MDIHTYTLHYSTLHTYMALDDIAPHHNHITSHDITSHDITLHCTTLHYVTLQCIASLCIALHTYLPTYILTYLPTYPPSYVPTYLRAYVHTNACIRMHIHTHIYIYIHIHIPQPAPNPCANKSVINPCLQLPKASAGRFPSIKKWPCNKSAQNAAVVWSSTVAFAQFLICLHKHMVVGLDHPKWGDNVVLQSEP